MAIRAEHVRGDKIGELVYIAPTVNIGKKRQAIFLCRCGVEFVTRIDRAKGLRVKSCGCSTGQLQSDAYTTHGLTKHPLYRVWKGMMYRCYKLENDNYHQYGGRGVTVCDEWKESVQCFVGWAVENGYQAGLELDKDMLGGDSLIYSPETCCWLTPKENCQYKRNNQFSLLDGEKMTDTAASLKLGHDANYVSKIRCGAARNKYPNLVLLDRDKLLK